MNNYRFGWIKPAIQHYAIGWREANKNCSKTLRPCFYTNIIGVLLIIIACLVYTLEINLNTNYHNGLMLQTIEQGASIKCVTWFE